MKGQHNYRETAILALLHYIKLL